MNEPKKVGVFICQCGGNISDFVDTEELRRMIEKEPGVISAQVNMFTCSDAGQQNIVKEIQEKHLDGIVVASCSPKLHLNTFRAAAQRAGLNQYQYTQVNIREQCSWAHTHDKASATEKAFRLIRAGITHTVLSEPMEKLRVETLPSALVIGAGVAGLRASIAISDIGISVYLIEKSAEAGGQVRRWGKLFPNLKDGKQITDSLIEEIRRRDNVTLFTGSELVEKAGHVGDFSVKIKTSEKDHISLKVGSIIVASGFEPYTPEEKEYGFGLEGVITLPEYEELLKSNKGELHYHGKPVKTVSYIYCVGSRENTKENNPHLYCSRYCCSAASFAAIQTGEIDLGIHQFHIYRDIRTYGKYETLYNEALRQQSFYLRFTEEAPPQVTSEEGKLIVRVKDTLAQKEEVEITSDLVVLVTGIVPRQNDQLIDVLKLPVGKDGFFNEIHPKLRPVETVIDGIFIAGTGQGPKNIAESVASAMAAVSKTAGLLLKGYVDLEPFVAQVDAECIWCGECAKVCPYGAIEQVASGNKQIAQVSAVLCKGEGACVPVCPYQAISVKGYTHQEITTMIDALAREVIREKKDTAKLS